MGTQLPQKKGHSPHPNFWPMSMEVSLSPRNVVLYGVAAPPKRGRAPPPVFVPCQLWPNGWMDKDATWYGSRPRPRPHCIRRTPSSPAKGTQQPMSFGPMSIVATSPISATAELLYQIPKSIETWKFRGHFGMKFRSLQKTAAL